MGISRQDAFRIVVPVGQQLQLVHNTLADRLQQQGSKNPEWQFQHMVLGQFEAATEQARVLITWAQRLLANLEVFEVKVFGVSAQPPARLFLKTVPSPKQQSFLHMLMTLNDYLRQYELPLIQTTQAFRIPAEADSISHTCFEYLDMFRHLVIDQCMRIEMLQFQRLSEAGEWVAVHNIFLQQPVAEVPATMSYQSVVA